MKRRDVIVGSDVRLDLTAVLARERNYRPSPAEWPVAIFSTQAWRDYAKGPDLGWEALENWLICHIVKREAEALFRTDDLKDERPAP